MNIFVVDEDPIIAAKQLCDKHVVKMIVEGCQMLSTIHHLANGNLINQNLYKSSFKNHPCTIWARQSVDNYLWLANHTLELASEYTRRYNKIHKAYTLSYWFVDNIPTNIYNVGLTEFAQAMPDKYKNTDSVFAYRQYYIHEKSRFAKWKFTDAPEWYTQGLKNVQMQVLQ